MISEGALSPFGKPTRRLTTHGEPFASPFLVALLVMAEQVAARNFIASSLPSLSTADKQVPGDERRPGAAGEKSISTWPKNWKCSNCGAISSRKCRIGCSRRSASTICASR